MAGLRLGSTKLPRSCSAVAISLPRIFPQQRRRKKKNIKSKTKQNKTNGLPPHPSLRRDKFGYQGQDRAVLTDSHQRARCTHERLVSASKPWYKKEKVCPRALS